MKIFSKFFFFIGSAALKKFWIDLTRLAIEESAKKRMKCMLLYSKSVMMQLKDLYSICTFTNFIFMDILFNLDISYEECCEISKHLKKNS